MAQDTSILPAHHWQQAGPDDECEIDSTASLTSSIYDYRTLHGRTFHSEQGETQYWATNDDRLGDVLDINHHLSTLALDDQLFLAPLEKGKVKRALDLGTGTGVWAIDFADQFPEAEVIGTDISPTQSSWVPPNVKFEIEDFNKTWSYPKNHFDFIHIRWLIGSPEDWYVLLKQSYDALAPGGWFESYEVSAFIESDDGTVTDNMALGQWGKIFVEGGNKLNRSFLVLQEGLQRKALEAAGFVDIQEHDIKMPIGTWPADPKLKELGAYAQLVLTQDPEGWVLFMTNTLGWTREQILNFVAAVRKESRSSKVHPFYRQKVVWGRKPAAQC